MSQPSPARLDSVMNRRASPSFFVPLFFVAADRDLNIVIASHDCRRRHPYANQKPPPPASPRDTPYPDIYIAKLCVRTPRAVCILICPWQCRDFVPARCENISDFACGEDNTTGRKFPHKIRVPWRENS